MNSFTITGKIHEITDEQQITASFRKREFVLEIEDGKYPQLPKFQTTQDRCGLLNSFNKGDEVTVHFNLAGRAYNKPDGTVTYFTNLNVWRIDPVKSEQAIAPGQEVDSMPSPSEEEIGSIGLDDELPF